MINEKDENALVSIFDLFRALLVIYDEKMIGKYLVRRLVKKPNMTIQEHNTFMAITRWTISGYGMVMDDQKDPITFEIYYPSKFKFLNDEKNMIKFIEEKYQVFLTQPERPILIDSNVFIPVKETE